MKHFVTTCLLLSFFAAAAQQPDTLAIKLLLEKESATWRAGDIKAHAGCWHVQPYSKILVSTTDGKCFTVAPSLIINPPAGMAGNGGSAVNSNYGFSIQKKTAWVSHDEVAVAADGSKSYSHEIRLLEKIKGQWKLVGQSIHMYVPQ